MHVLMINGSPRIEKNSNTDKIMDAFARGMVTEGATFEKYAVSARNTWDGIREAYVRNTEILIALPLYVESVPGLLLEFLETLPAKDKTSRISFILQSGFAEASQLRCGEMFLKRLSRHLGVRYGGTLIKGDCFGIRLMSKDEAAKMTEPFIGMGRAFVKENGFLPERVKKFAGPEYFSLPMRLLIQLMFKTIAKKRFLQVAGEWGCTVPLEYRPWE